MPPAGLHHFHAIGPPRGLAALVAARAVIMPICGSKDVAAVAVDALRVVDRWRARVRFLARHGWELANAGHGHGSRKWRMLNCPPSAVAVTPKGAVPCHTRSICPHCWGREAVEHWRAIDLALFGPALRGRLASDRLLGTALVNRIVVVEAPFRGMFGRPTLPDLLDRRTKTKADPAWDFSTKLMTSRDADFRGLNKAGATGGFETLLVRPVRLDPSLHQEGQEAPPFDGWRVEARQVIVVPTEALAGFLGDAKVRPGCLARPLKTVDAPTRGQLAVAVASACRYPLHLLQGDRRFALAVLRARKGRRLTTRFGCCYGGSR